VCGNVRQCARPLVCDGARDGVRQCVGLCVAVSDSKHGSVRAMRAVRTAVCGSAVGSVQQRVRTAVCGSASARRRKCVAVRSTYIYIYIYTKSLTIRGSGNEPNIPLISTIVVTDQYELLLEIKVNLKI
jgi:hypothetical protein